MNCEKYGTDMVAARAFPGGAANAFAGLIVMAFSALALFGLLTGAAVPPDGNLVPSFVAGAVFVLLLFVGVRARRKKPVWKCKGCDQNQVPDPE